MDNDFFKNISDKAKALGAKAVDGTNQLVGSGFQYLQKSIGKLKLLGSNETSTSYDHRKTDEKHYFLIPFRLDENDYVLYSMRCLPEGVAPVNDLPKRRVFHLPQENSSPLVKQILQNDKEDQINQNRPEQSGLGGHMMDFADRIDRLDNRVFGGVLLVGGAVALINPVAGAAVIAKSLAPSIGLMLSKMGLKYAGENLNERSLKTQIEKAKEEVLKEFHGAETESIINPILAELDLALNTTEEQHDPLLEFEFRSADFGDKDQVRMRQLTYKAISNTYRDVLKSKKKHGAACLGAEDVRWLELIQELAGQDA